ncbi:group III truncated hemoglobin [Terrihabitans sp. B22-R8]|uniref:group III truncated hemoglobin n=1 Tax=Terrihabitans sp. B22-R8 TaxID=3425128 RepID=UPI00403CEF9E
MSDTGGAELHLDEADITRLVHTFYDRVRRDELIGPVFAAKVEDWDHHLATLCDFWSSIMLRSRRYQGRPMRAHLTLPIEDRHFDRWLALFEQTTRDLFAPPIAEAFLQRARQIADSFEFGLATQRGEMRSPRHSPRPVREP